MKVVHLTSAHGAFDVRIFYKECVSIARAGHEVVLVVPHEHDEAAHGVQVRAVPPVTGGRLSRMTRTVWRVFRQALRERGDIYHFHDPELLPVGVLLKLLQRRVVYDVHENYPATIRRKEWLPAALRPPLAWGFEVLERCAAMCFDGVVAVNDDIAARFPARKTIQVRNYAIIEQTRVGPRQ